MAVHQQIKQYIIDHPGASLTELSKIFTINEEQMRFFLDLWVKSGRLKRIEADAPCQKSNCACNTCILWSLETYHWQ